MNHEFERPPPLQGPKPMSRARRLFYPKPKKLATALEEQVQKIKEGAEK